jgi:Domain of unknown function (DUF4406)
MSDYKGICYISGPMRGYTEFNFPMFDKARDHYAAEDWIVLSPADHDRELYPDIEEWEGYFPGDTDKCPDFNFKKTLEWDLLAVCRSNLIVLLPGWENSKGAQLEKHVADVLGIPHATFSAHLTAI